MNTASKASNTFEAFFGIHEMLPWDLFLMKVWLLHWERPKSNIGMNIFILQFHINIMATNTHNKYELNMHCSSVNVG